MGYQRRNFSKVQWAQHKGITSLISFFFPPKDQCFLKKHLWKALFYFTLHNPEFLLDILCILISIVPRQGFCFSSQY